jgi:GNAT superfamily N-acetyltransferase
MTPVNASDISFRWAEMPDESRCRECDRSIPEDRVQRKIANGEILLALCHRQLVGYLRLEFLWQKLPFIGLIEIPQSFRRQGIGAAMLGFLEQFLRTRGYERLLSSSIPENQAGQLWHFKQGFSVCGELRGINPDDGDEVFFLKSLISIDQPDF